MNNILILFLLCFLFVKVSSLPYIYSEFSYYCGAGVIYVNWGMSINGTTNPTDDTACISRYIVSYFYSADKLGKEPLYVSSSDLSSGFGFNGGVSGGIVNNRTLTMYVDYGFGTVVEWEFHYTSTITRFKNGTQYNINCQNTQTTNFYIHTNYVLISNADNNYNWTLYPVWDLNNADGYLTSAIILPPNWYPSGSEFSNMVNKLGCSNNAVINSIFPPSQELYYYETQPITTTGQATTSNPTTNQPTTLNPTTGQITTSNPTTNQATTSNPTTGLITTMILTTALLTTGQITTGNEGGIGGDSNPDTTPLTFDSFTSNPSTQQGITGNGEGIGGDSNPDTTPLTFDTFSSNPITSEITTGQEATAITITSPTNNQETSNNGGGENTDTAFITLISPTNNQNTQSSNNPAPTTPENPTTGDISNLNPDSNPDTTPLTTGNDGGLNPDSNPDTTPLTFGTTGQATIITSNNPTTIQQTIIITGL